MRLRAINVYSSFLGEEHKTKDRTGFLREESDFLYHELYKTTKYINNNYCKQLNLCCNENVNGIVLGSYDSDGYPQIELPFCMDNYMKKTAFEKGLFWVNSLKEVLYLLAEQYEFDEEKVKIFINYLENKYSNSDSYEKIKSLLTDSND